MRRIDKLVLGLTLYPETSDIYSLFFVTRNFTLGMSVCPRKTFTSSVMDVQSKFTIWYVIAKTERVH